jgi:hypothetical protein
MKPPILLAAALLAACSEGGAGGTAVEDGGHAGGAGAPVDGGHAGAAGTGGVDAGTAGSGGTAGAADGSVPKPSPGDIQFLAKGPLPSGDQLLFNDWNPMPNTLHSIRPDGSGEIEVFRAYRIWSLGAARDGLTLAFASGDPEQEKNYGIALGDAIQHTWLYDVPTQSASVLSWGNLNDECHAFTAQADALFICRRWDFTAQGSSKGYQIARLSLPGGELELPTSPAANQLELHPRPTLDESALYFTLVEIASGKQTRKIVRQALPGGQPELVRESATLADLSPDGTRLLFSDHTQAGALFTMRLDGSELVKVASQGGTNAVWSPDGSRIGYLFGETQTCSHVQIVLADGSEAEWPLRVRDCGSAFITELAWVSVP